ncbi:MAG: DEAD/DEAH box helicase family protein [Bacteroidetes bacterium]|nr:DEAD/DEAH box helicase family protein [Bacteroidota bacterium]
MIDEVRDVIQQRALQHWLNKDKTGTCQIITGLGKTFISLHALYTMPRDYSKIHLFLAEQVDRVKDLRDDIEKYNKLFKRDVLNDYNLQFYCYQTVYKWKNRNFGLVIADEIHDSITPAYSKFYFNNQYEAIIGLSATVALSTKYIIDNKVITKGMYLNKIAPICFTYSIDDGQKDKTARELNIYVIYNELDNINKTVKAGNKKKPFYQTEKAAYSYWNKQHKLAWFEEDDEKRQLRIRITAHKRSSILYNLESKVKIAKRLLNNLHKKTIIFGNSIPSLLKITPNVISSKNPDVVNNRLRDDFDADKIKTIGSFKKLKQGANLNNLDNCIIMSYYSTDKDFIQRIGRLRNNNTVGNVFILLTKETQEEKWFDKIFEKINNLNLIYCDDVEDCIKKFNKK